MQHSNSYTVCPGLHWLQGANTANDFSHAPAAFSIMTLRQLGGGGRGSEEFEPVPDFFFLNNGVTKRMPCVLIFIHTFLMNFFFLFRNQWTRKTQNPKQLIVVMGRNVDAMRVGMCGLCFQYLCYLNFTLIPIWSPCISCRTSAFLTWNRHETLLLTPSPPPPRDTDTDIFAIASFHSSGLKSWTLFHFDDIKVWWNKTAPFSPINTSDMDRIQDEDSLKPSLKHSYVTASHHLFFCHVQLVIRLDWNRHTH